MAKRTREPNGTLIGCPDCSGVLMADPEGNKGHIRYICQVGHRYSTQSLLEAKERQLEEALWSVASLLKHIQLICETLAEQPGYKDAPDGRARLKARCRQVSAQEKTIRQIIEESQPPLIDQPKLKLKLKNRRS